MTDLTDIFDPCPSPEKPFALKVTFRRDRADRFMAQVLSLEGKPMMWGDRATFGIRGTLFAISAIQNRDYFEAFDGWWYEQDPERPYRERFREFVHLYESGIFAR